MSFEEFAKGLAAADADTVKQIEKMLEENEEEKQNESETE